MTTKNQTPEDVAALVRQQQNARRETDRRLRAALAMAGLLADANMEVVVPLYHPPKRERSPEAQADRIKKAQEKRERRAAKRARDPRGT